MKQNLSVILTTFNEEHNIREALQSVDWADEIIVVDSFSEDRTLEFASEYTDRLLRRAYQGPSDQKNWAIPQARHEWVLILDADERVTVPLKREIIRQIAQPGNPIDAFWISRQNYFLGRQIKYSGWQNDAVIRLIRRDKCRYNDKLVHEEIETTGLQVGRIEQPLDHFTFKNTSHFLDKMQRYARWSAEDHRAGTGKIGWFHLLFKPLFRFFKHFFIQRGFLDGKRGFIISAIMAWGVFLRYLHLMENKN